MKGRIDSINKELETKTYNTMYLSSGALSKIARQGLPFLKRYKQTAGR